MHRRSTTGGARVSRRTTTTLRPASEETGTSGGTDGGIDSRPVVSPICLPVPSAPNSRPGSSMGRRVPRRHTVQVVASAAPRTQMSPYTEEPEELYVKEKGGRRVVRAVTVPTAPSLAAGDEGGGTPAGRRSLRVRIGRNVIRQ